MNGMTIRKYKDETSTVVLSRPSLSGTSWWAAEYQNEPIQNLDEPFLRTKQIKSRSAREICERLLVQGHNHERNIGRLSRHPLNNSQGREVQLWRNKNKMSSIHRKDTSRNGKHKIGGCDTIVAAIADIKTYFAATKRTVWPDRRQQAERKGTTPVAEERNTVGAEIGEVRSTKQQTAATTNAWPRRKDVNVVLGLTVKKTCPTGR